MTADPMLQFLAGVPAAVALHRSTVTHPAGRAVPGVSIITEAAPTGSTLVTVAIGSARFIAELGGEL